MAEAGGGAHAVVRTDGDAVKAMREFYARAGAPLLSGFALEGSGFDKNTLFPARVPHLTSGRPVMISGKVNNVESLRLQAKALRPDGSVWKDNPSIVKVANVGLASLWARKQVAHIQLYEGLVAGRGADLPEVWRQKVVELGVRYQIMTDYTSFVAVEEMVANKQGKSVRVLQPSVAPEGVDMHSAGALMASSRQASGQGVAAYSLKRGLVNGQFNYGYAEGGSGGIGDRLGNLMGGGGGTLQKSKMAQIKIPGENGLIVAPAGVRSEREILLVVRSRLPGLRHVYNKHLKGSPGFVGKVVLRWTLSAQGDVVKIEVVSSTTGQSSFDEEIRQAVSRWRWKTIPSGTVVVTLPIEFAE